MATGFPTIVITFVTRGFADSKVGIPYSYFVDVLDYTPPVSFAIISGALPVSLVLNPVTGEVSGTPLPGEVGEYTVEIEATDSLAKTGSATLPIRVVPDLGNARRYQMEDSVEGATEITPIEGRTAFTARRFLERLIARTQGVTLVEINPRYMLDARDLQIVSFNAVPLQSLDDGMNALLGMIAGFPTGLDNTSGVGPYVTVDVNDNFNILGIGSILVTKNIPMNRLEVSFTGAPLSAPFSMLPAPSGDITGVADTAAINAFFAGAPQEWIVAPTDAGAPYYINANIVPTPGLVYRLTGKNRNAFSVIGVGAIRDWEGIQIAEHVNFSNVRPRNALGGVLLDECYVQISMAGNYVDATSQIRASKTYFLFSAAANGFMQAAGQFEGHGCFFDFGVMPVLTVFKPSGLFRLRLDGCSFSGMSAVGTIGVDGALVGVGTGLCVLVGTEFRNGVLGVPIANRSIMAGNLGSQFVESGTIINSGAPAPIF